MTVGFYTLGCKVNQYETQALSFLFQKEGIQTVPLEEHPDVVVLNSCTVTAESDRKDRQALRRLRREHPHALLILTGCMPQAFPESAAALSEPDIITGNAGNDRIIALLRRRMSTGEQVVDIPSHARQISPLVPDGFGERTRAYIKIEDGCNRFCSYCIIPTARGRVRSKPLEAIEAEARALAGRGFLEAVLVGINLSAYGGEGIDLADAVNAAARPSGLRRIRLGSLEPDQLTDDLIERLSHCQKLCPQFHLSLQSGCDATLRRMNRHYDTAFYRSLCQTLRERFGGEDGCAITTDVMVGFPGETQEEFDQSLSFVEEIGLAKVHIFAYSRREGTPAARAQDQICNAEKQRRSHIMMEAADRSARRFLSAQVGRVEEVLLETGGEDGLAHGFTANYTPVRICCKSGMPGQIEPIRITGVEENACVGIPAAVENRSAGGPFTANEPIV